MKTRNIFNSGLYIKILTAVFLIHIYIAGIARAGRPELTLEADKQEIGLGETLKVVAEMSWKQTENIADDVIIVKVTPPSCSLLELVDSKQTTSSRLQGDGVYAKKIMEYYYKAKEKGEGTIEPVVVEYLAGISGIGEGGKIKDEDREIVKSEAINIKVVPFLSGMAKKLAIGLIFAGVAVLLGFAALFVKKRVKVPGKKTEPATVDTHLEEEFLEGMKLFNKYIVEGDFKKYYTYTSSALSNYISKKYAVPVPVKSGSNEIDKLPEQLSGLYSEWNSMEEKVRFSGYKPGKNELGKLTRETERYFRSLIPDPDPEETIETVS